MGIENAASYAYGYIFFTVNRYGSIRNKMINWKRYNVKRGFHLVMRHWNKICLQARVHGPSVPSAGMGCDQPGHEAHRPVPIPGSTSQKMNIQNRVHFSFLFFHSGLLNRNVVYYRHGRERKLLGLVTKSNFLHGRHSKHLRTSMN